MFLLKDTGQEALLAARFGEAFTLGKIDAYGMSEQNAALVRVRLAGGSVSKFAEVAKPIAIVADEGFVFWAERDDKTGQNRLQRLVQEDTQWGRSSAVQ